MATTNAREMFKKYPKLFMEMYVHSMEEDPDHPDDIGVIYSKIMANVANPGTYWMPYSERMQKRILNDFKKNQ